MCAFKSFPAVATTALSSVRTIRGEHCLIAKRFVCAAKSFRGLLAPIEAQGADSPNVTCVRSNRFRQSMAMTTRIFGPFNGHQTLRTYWFLCFRWLFTKRFGNQCNINNFVAEDASLSFPGRQTCVGVRSGDLALLQLASRFKPFRKPSINVS